MTGAPPQVSRKEPNDSSTTTSIKAQPPALPLSASNSKAIYEEFTINDLSTEKFVETQSKQNKWIKPKLSKLEATKITATAAWSALVLNSLVFCQQ